MAKALIKLVYKQVIDSKSQGNFERNMFRSSYDEFLLESEAYNPQGKFKTFDEIKTNDPAASSLHYKLSFAVGHLIEALDSKIPGLHDTLGNNLLFDSVGFKLLASSITDPDAHKIVIYYNTGLFTLHEVVGTYLLVSAGENLTQSSDKAAETFLLNMQPGLSVVSYRELNDKAAELLSNVRRFYFPRSN
jgi:hypothetical protein